MGTPAGGCTPPGHTLDPAAPVWLAVPKGCSWCWKPTGFGVRVTHLGLSAWLSAHLLSLCPSAHLPFSLHYLRISIS